MVCPAPLQVGQGTAVCIMPNGVWAVSYTHLDVYKRQVDAIDLWTVRVFGRPALGTVFAVTGRPFIGSHAGRQPQPQTEAMSGQRMQVQSAMRSMAVQV